MKFSLEKSREILRSTPDVLDALLRNLSADWTSPNEGGETWSAYDVVGHLIESDQQVWVPRAEIVLSDRADKTFAPFNREAMFESSGGKSLPELLDDFKNVRRASLERLASLNVSENDFGKTGINPLLGEVQLSQLLATWAVHDLDHLAQISRVMAKQYTEAVGPWVKFLRVLRD